MAAEYAATHPDRLSKLVLVDFLADGRGFGKVRPQPIYDDAKAPISRFRLQPSGTLLNADALRRLGEKSIKKMPDGRLTWKFDWGGHCGTRLFFENSWARFHAMPSPVIWSN